MGACTTRGLDNNSKKSKWKVLSMNKLGWLHQTTLIPHLHQLNIIELLELMHCYTLTKGT